MGNYRKYWRMGVMAGSIPRLRDLGVYRTLGVVTSSHGRNLSPNRRWLYPRCGRDVYAYECGIDAKGAQQLLLQDVSLQSRRAYVAR